MVHIKIYNPEVGYVDVPERPERIISFSESITETIFMLGAGDRIVGVDSWSQRPREAMKKRKVGDYVHLKLDVIKELKPDLILTATGVQRPIIEQLKNTGYPVYPIPVPISVYEIINNVLIIGGLIGEQEKALELADNLMNNIENLKRRSLKNPLKAYIEIDLGGPTIPAYFSHITSALRLLNIINVYTHEKQSYLYGMQIPGFPVFDLSDVIRKDPDLIIYESKNKFPTRDELTEIIKKRSWESIKAVKENKMIIIPNDTLAHYGPSFFNELEKVILELKLQANITI
ncbi:MAG: ABC transporter substrate-binding protein [Thermoprotei archaeon]